MTTGRDVLLVAGHQVDYHDLCDSNIFRRV